MVPGSPCADHSCVPASVGPRVSCVMPICTSFREDPVSASCITGGKLTTQLPARPGQRLNRCCPAKGGQPSRTAVALTDSASFPVSRLGDPWRLHGRVREQVSQNSVPNQLTWKYESRVKSISRVRLLATPWTEAYQAPLSMGLSRQEYQRGVPFPSPGDLPDPGIDPGSPVLQTDALRLTHQGSVTTTIMDR